MTAPASAEAPMTAVANGCDDTRCDHRRPKEHSLRSSYLAVAGLRFRASHCYSGPAIEKKSSSATHRSPLSPQLSALLGNFECVQTLSVFFLPPESEKKGLTPKRHISDFLTRLSRQALRSPRLPSRPKPAPPALVSPLNGSECRHSIQDSLAFAGFFSSPLFLAFAVAICLQKMPLFMPFLRRH